MERSVFRVLCAASARVTYPRSTPTGYAVSANPIAATLEKLFVGQRSGVRPLFGSLRSQNQLKVRRSSVSRNAVCLAVSAPPAGTAADGGGPTAELGAVAQPKTKASAATAA